MATFAEIQTRVTGELIDLPAFVVAAIPGLVNAAMREAQRRHNFKVMETLGGPYVTVAATRVLTAAPSNFKASRDQPYFVWANGEKSDMLFVASRDAALDHYSLSNPLDIGSPRVIVEGEQTDAGVGNWELYPYTDSESDWVDGEYRVYVPYWRYVAALSVTNTTNWFTVEGEEYLVRKAASLGFFLDRDEQRGAIADQRAEKELGLLIRADKLARVAGVQTLVPHLDANTPKIRW